MGWWMAAVGVASIAGGISGNREARSAGKRNAQLINMETAEQIRRMDRQYRYEIGSAEATYAARGLLLSGSPQSILDEMTAEYRRQRSWVKRTGDQRARAARKSGQYIGTSQIVSGVATLGSALTSPNPAAQPADSTPQVTWT